MKANYRTIGIKNTEQALDEAAEVMKAVMRGETVTPQPPEYNFTSFEAFRKALPLQRFNLLKIIRDKEPESLQELAAITGRDIKNISEDVKVLVEMGIVEIKRKNRAKQPRLTCDGIRIEVAI